MLGNLFKMMGFGKEKYCNKNPIFHYKRITQKDIENVGNNPHLTNLGMFAISKLLVVSRGWMWWYMQKMKETDSVF